MNKLGKKIFMTRKAKKISNEELAEILGISSSHMYNIEIGNFKPSNKVLQKICKTLELDFKEMFELKTGKSVGQFSGEIKFARLEKSLTLAELSKKIGISKSELSHIENGLRRPTNNNLKKICNFLELDYNYLVKIHN